jgi:hypothetical protein
VRAVAYTCFFLFVHILFPEVLRYQPDLQ